MKAYEVRIMVQQVSVDSLEGEELLSERQAVVVDSASIKPTSLSVICAELRRVLGGKIPGTEPKDVPADRTDPRD